MHKGLQQAAHTGDDCTERGAQRIDGRVAMAFNDGVCYLLYQRLGVSLENCRPPIAVPSQSYE